MLCALRLNTVVKYPWGELNPMAITTGWKLVKTALNVGSVFGRNRDIYRPRMFDNVQQTSAVGPDMPQTSLVWDSGLLVNIYHGSGATGSTLGHLLHTVIPS